MSLNKYRMDRNGDVQPNGSQPVYTDWIGGPSLAAVRNCPIYGREERRTVYATGEADTWFSIPAACRIAGKTQRGCLAIETVDDLDSGDKLGYVFRPYKA